MKNYILNESIDRIVSEAVSNIKKKNAIDMIIESVVTEHVEELNEAKKNKKNKKKKNSKSSKNKKKVNKKRAIIQWLRQPEINKAAVRRKIEGEPENQGEEDAKRSLWDKKINQTYGKDFSDKEVNRIYAYKTSIGQ